MRWSGRALFLICLLGLIPSASSADDKGVLTMTLEQAVEYALAHHPSLGEARASEAQKEAQVAKAKTGYLPQVYAVAQENRASANQNPGTWVDLPGLPGVVPAVEGPLHDTFGLNSWNSGASLFVAQDVVGLLRQMALVDADLAQREGSHFALKAQELTVAFNASDAFLGEIAAKQVLRAAKAGVERARAFVTAVKGLVASGMRPGADLSRAEAALAMAENEMFRASQDEGVARTNLAQALGIEDRTVEPVPENFLSFPSATLESRFSESNPLIREAAAQLKAAHEFTRAVKLQYLPRVYIAGYLFTQGSAVGGGTVTPGAGLLPTVPNWALAVNVVIPFTQMVTTRAELQAARANERFALARYSDVVLQVKSDIKRAQTILDAAIQMAKNAPIELSAAQATWTQNTARYRVGLMTALDVADAQNLLTRAEVDNAVAGINVWRAMLLMARASGDLAPFFELVRSVNGGGRR